jgi:hypothetical protein
MKLRDVPSRAQCLLNITNNGHQQLMSIILATWEAEIVRIKVPGQSQQIVCETPISKIARAK